MNNQNELNVNINFNQTQKANSNHDFNVTTSQLILEARIVKLIQQTMIIFIKTNSNQ